MTPSAQTAPVLTQNSAENPRFTCDRQVASRPHHHILLAPALIVLGALVVYPIIYTLIRSFYSKSGSTFVGFDNYIAMFTNDTTYTAIRNNVMWVIIAPVVCTFLGLIFAVLMEKLRWKTAFRLIIFMPMAISMLAAGVIFRTMFQEDPNLGVVNATIAGVHRTHLVANQTTPGRALVRVSISPPTTASSSPSVTCRQDPPLHSHHRYPSDKRSR